MSCNKISGPFLYQVFIPFQRCSGSVTFWYGSGCGSGSSNPYHWLTDPDADPYQNLQCQKNVVIFLKIIFLARKFCVPVIIELPTGLVLEPGSVLGLGLQARQNRPQGLHLSAGLWIRNDSFRIRLRIRLLRKFWAPTPDLVTDPATPVSASRELRGKLAMYS
jgi:hypothetical protein